MISHIKVLPLTVLALSTLLTACGGSDEPPAVIATTTNTVQNQKAQPAHDSQIRQLDDQKLEILFSGREVRGLSPDGRKWQAKFNSSGNASIRWEGPSGQGSDTGTWEIADNANCVTWQNLMDGEENCMTVYKVDEGQYNLFNDNGSMNSLIMALEL